MFCHTCGNQLSDETTFCPNCGAALTPSSVPSQKVPYDAPAVFILTMKWHKFFVCFSLWIAAVLNLIYGLGSFVGNQYEGKAQLVYLTFPDLKTVDVIYRFLLIGISVFGFLAAHRLLKRKKGAPRQLLFLYAGNIVVALVYALGCVAAVSENPYIDITNIIRNGIGSAVAYGILILANNIYYNKRKGLFVN